jgi:hypothetical protein
MLPANLPSLEEFGNGTLVPFADSLWTAATPIRFAGIWFPHVMTVVRCSNGELVLHSPCRPSTPLVDAVSGIGRVAHVVAPNWFHDLYLTDYRVLYPAATFWGPSVLRRQRGNVLIDCELNGAARPPWISEMPHLTLAGVLTFDESIFFHTPSSTLIVADLLMNLSATANAPRFTRVAYRLSGTQDRLAMPPYLRWFGITARRPLHQATHQIEEWNPDRLIVGHGTPILHEAMARLRSALSRK